MVATGARTIGIEEPSDGAKMKSVLEIDDLSDFLVQAQLANKDFQSEREQFLNIDNIAQEYFPTGQPVTGAIYEDHAPRATVQNFSFHELSVPRRPAWTPGVTTAEELEAMENESFLEWRRGVAKREEEIAALSFNSHGGGVSGASVTPYEKNLHVWRQLWRVLERSAVVLQIVDARNPLFYLSEDLRTYAMDELGKPMLMVVNKSDFLTEGQRKQWSEYFKERGIDHLFFSAVDEQKKIDDAIAVEKRGEMLDEQQKVISDDENDSDFDAFPKECASRANEGNLEASKDATHEEQLFQDNLLGITNPLTREQLLDALDAFAHNHGCTPDERYDNRIQYGMVGFPNGEVVGIIYTYKKKTRIPHFYLFWIHSSWKIFCDQCAGGELKKYSWRCPRCSGRAARENKALPDPLTARQAGYDVMRLSRSSLPELRFLHC